MTKKIHKSIGMILMRQFKNPTECGLYFHKWQVAEKWRYVTCKNCLRNRKRCKK